MTRLQQQAAPSWSAAINRLFLDDLAISAEWAEDESVKHVAWQNHPVHQCRLLSISSDRFEHVFGVNPEYAFDITRTTTGQYAVRGITDAVEVPDTATSLESLVPSWTFLGYPLMMILDRSLFVIDSAANMEDGQVRLDLHVSANFRINRPPYIYFINHGRADTRFTLWLDPGRSWQLTRAVSSGPGPGMQWEQNVTFGPIATTATMTATLNAEVQRRYSHTTTEEVLPQFDESTFYLAHYGLSESTAGFLMGSRRYIFVFCGLFFGAIFFRILASVIKRKRATKSEGAL